LNINSKKLLLKVLFFLEHSVYFFLFRVFGKSIKRIMILPGYIITLKFSFKYLYPLLYLLRFHTLCLFNILADIGSADFIGSIPRFTLSYNILSLKFNVRFFVKINVSNICKLLSTCSIFNSSKWIEREIYEFFGIGFYLNGDLRHLLLDYGFKGFPLLKDFPISGFIEVVYSDLIKKLTYIPVELVQEYRKNYIKRFLK